jgi:pyruvate/2-oxoglutarate dehydrogenase complex dihydrolipoamide dehydrogenase (E3) component
LQQPLNHLLKAQVLGQPTGLCKLIVRSNGTLVGAHLLGPQAVEWSTVLAFAIQQKLKITMLADMLLPSPTLAEILQQTASNYRFQVRRSELWRYSLEEFFAWRRYWAQ